MPPTFRRVGTAVAAVLLAAMVVGVYLAANGGGTDAPTAPATTRATTTARAAPTARAATSSTTGASGLKTVRRSALPAEAQATLALIAKGGPYPYDRDGVVFENREGILPRKASGYYHEYTVETPGSDDRGARRIVAGKSGELFYTDDHYVSFREVVP